MNILILGSGGRESTLVWKLSQSPKSKRIFVAPGNAGTAHLAENANLDISNFDAIKQFVRQNDIQMLVVGPEQPLVDGIYDFFNQDKEVSHIAVIGPSKEGALLEGSKEKAKEFMTAHQIPTAAYQAFTAKSLLAGKDFLKTLKPPYVLKADGLAAGKGVLILDDLDEAQQELENMLTNDKFGEASKTVVIEEFLKGIELSVFALTDGETYKILPNAKDYKRIGEGDTGLNTGGMGAVSPVPFADDDFMKKVETRVVKPTIEGLKKEQIDYKGFVFFGLMNVEGDPYVIEYNVRMGDPETEVVLPRVKNDLVEVFKKLSDGRLEEINIETEERAATTIMIVSGGYPESYEKGKEITGINDVSPEKCLVFQAGTVLKNKKTLTNGGRVLALTTFGKNFKEALALGYQQIQKINFDKMNYRKDLGKDLENYL